jgi:hydroxyacylglutathione hydrolase
MLDIKRVVCGAYQENAYIVGGDIVIDPGDDLEALVMAAPSPRAVLLTHGHFDHMLAAGELQKKFGVPVYVHEEDAPMLADGTLAAYNAAFANLPMPEGIKWRRYEDEIFGFRVIHTPGHTRGSVCLYSQAEKLLFSGDTLFRAGYGRTDLPGGSDREMYDSLAGLLALPGDTRVLPGHGGETTIGIECRRYGR